MKPSSQQPLVAGVERQASQIRRMANQEFPLVALLRVLGRVIDLARGKVSAHMFGWRKSYLGYGSKVIGTRSIMVGEKIAIGRYAWIEAVTEHLGQTYVPTIRMGRSFCASERLHISAINHIEIGDNCLIGSCVYISDHNHGSYSGENQSKPDEPPLTRKLVSSGPVIIGANVWIGDNVVIIGPVRIGDGVVVGANSVVTRDVPENVIVAGAPAKIVKQFNYSSSKWEVPK